MKKLILQIFCVALAIDQGKAQTFSFTPAPGSPIAISTVTGSNRCIVSYDINGDGKKDLLTGNSYDSELNIFHGLGNGQFTVAPGSPLLVGNGPCYFAVADFNNDLIPDLAIAKYFGSNQIAVYNGTGVGTFTQAVGSPYTTGNQPTGLAVADFNLDGNMDIVTSNANSSTTHVFMGNGSSNFTLAPGFPITTGGLSYFVVTGQFNADNFPDFAVISQSTNVLRVMLGTGTGSFNPAPGSPYTTANQPFCVKAKDINGDGIDDIAVPCASGNLNIFLGSASGSFIQAAGSPIAVTTDLYEASYSDFDLNGTQDIIVTSPNQNNIRILSGNGNGTFSNPTFSTITGFTTPHSVCSDDFNGDGRTDIAQVDWGGPNLHVHLNTGTVCAISASYNYSTGTQGSVNFTSTSTGTVALTTYSWNYGDSSGGMGASTTHTYVSNGSYTVTLTVTNSTVAPACIQTYTSVVTVTNACSINQSFTYTNNTGGSYNFSSTSTGTNASTVYSWNFGDSSTGAGQMTNHTYTANGTYTISFTVVNTSTPSCFITTSAVITVTDACSITGSFSVTSSNNTFFNFTSAITGTTAGAIFNWDFGDSNSGSGPTSSHQYTNNGVYTVSLTVVNLTSPPCSKTYTQQISVFGLMGLQTYVANKNCKIYPNPVSDKLFVELNGNLNSQLIIYSAIGEELMRSDLKENKTEIKLDHLANGFYYYSVKNNSKNFSTGQLIICK